MAFTISYEERSIFRTFLQWIDDLFSPSLPVNVSPSRALVLNIQQTLSSCQYDFFFLHTKGLVHKSQKLYFIKSFQVFIILSADMKSKTTITSTLFVFL